MADNKTIICEQPVKPTRLAWADSCRVLAIYGVILIHSCGASFYQYGKIPLPEWLQSVFLDSVVRCSVPLFVMLSGALIFGNDPDGKTSRDSFAQILKRILRIAIPLLTWSLIHLWYLAHNGAHIPLVDILKQPAMYHLWFVYMIIGIYLFLPILRPIFSGLQTSPAQLYYFTLLWLLITSLTVYWPIPLLSLLQQKSLFGYGGYFLLGAVIVSRPPPLSNLSWTGIFTAATGITMFVTWHLSAKSGAPIETGFVYFSPNVVVASVAAFVLLSRVRIVKGYWASLLKHLSEYSFFIYFIHILVLEYVRFSTVMVELSERIPTGLTIILISLVTFAISLLAAMLVRLIPGAKHLFG